MTDAASTPSRKTGIVLLNMGGPDKREDVKPFLFNLFSDPEIIKLPLSFLFQKLLAWIIVQSRGNAAEKNYQYMGGGSPQLPNTKKQQAALEKKLAEKNLPNNTYIAMRYWHPFTDETLAKIKADGIEQLIAVTLYPHFSFTTTGSSINELKRGLKRNRMPLSLGVVSGYHRNETYLKALADTIQQGLDNNPWSCDKEDVTIVFSAHSLPLSHVKRTKDPYPDHIFNCIETVLKTHFPSHFNREKWGLCYQSKVGKMPWLGPYTDSLLHYYAAHETDNLLMVPISFVSDHVETLVEIDIEYKEVANELGIKHCYRAPTLNDHPLYIDTLVELIEEKYHNLNGRQQTNTLTPTASTETPVGV